MSQLYKFLTPTNRCNLLKLAEYLESLPPRYQHFEMKDFFNINQAYDGPKTLFNYARHNGGVHTCGTVACAIGHGPSAGILFPKSLAYINKEPGGYPRYRVDWFQYTARFFLNGYSGTYDGIKNGPAEVFVFLFGSEWSGVDNSHYGAAGRIRYILDNQPLPENWRYYVNLKPRHRRIYQAYRKSQRRAPTPA